MAMKILIVNDDGIDAAGIHYLVEWAAGHGEVTVCAPKHEQSGKSHAINFIEPFEIKKIDFQGASEAYSVDSTPADCTRFGILGLNRQYDLVISGINYGINMSGDIVYSGTVGAIFEAEHLGHCALAISIAKDTAMPKLKVLDSILTYINQNHLFEYSMLYNINIPKDPCGIRITRQGDAYFKDEFIKLDGDMYLQRGHSVPETNPKDLTLDTVAFYSGYISITPMTLSRTNSEAFENLSQAN